MPEIREPKQIIVSTDLLRSAQNVIQQILDVTDHPATLVGKLGTAENTPLSDPELAHQLGNAARDISEQFAIIKAMLLQADRILGTPLASISQSTNDAIAAAGINNRSGRRRSYTEDTLQTMVRLSLVRQEHLPVIRAAGYAYPPPDNQHDVDLRALVADITDHMTKLDEPQTVDEIRQTIPHWNEIITRTPHLVLQRRIRGATPAAS